MEYLFERLERLGKSPAEAAPAFDLHAAVQAQIQRIVSAHAWRFGDDAMNLLNFGMPSIVEVARGSPLQLDRYAQRLKTLIGRYEPRLLQAQVDIEKVNNAMSPYRVVVTGMLAVDGVHEAFHFPTALADR